MCSKTDRAPSRACTLASPVPETAWVTTAQLAADTMILANHVAREIDGVVGIARSGLIPASIVASLLHVPLAAISEAGYKSVGGGWRTRELMTGFKRILLVDDTVNTGRALGRILPLIRDARPDSSIIVAAIYSTRLTVPGLDIAVRQYPSCHYMEWNFFNSIQLLSAACDLDGIFCHDIPATDDDDGPRYSTAIRHALPLFTSHRFAVPAIFTGRLEKYRPLTVDWLIGHGITTRDLRMFPGKTNADRKGDAAIEWKAHEYARSHYRLYVESSQRAAPLIANLSRKPVLCPAAGSVFIPEEP